MAITDLTLWKPSDVRVLEPAIPGTPYQPPQCTSTSQTIQTASVSLNTGSTGTTTSTYNNTDAGITYEWYSDDESSLAVGGSGTGFWGPSLGSTGAYKV